VKKLVYLVLIAVLAVSLIFAGCGEEEEETPAEPAEPAEPTEPAEPAEPAEPEPETKILRLSYPLPEFDAMVASAIQACEEFNEGAAGRYEIQVFPGGVLGGMLEVYDMTVAGAIDMCDVAPDFLSEKDLLFGPQGLPFLFKDAQAFQKFLDKMRTAIWQEREAEKYNLQMLTLHLTFPHDAWCGTKPIKTLEDWEGKVVWVGGPAEAEAITALGASPVTLDWADGYPSIEKGVVDGGTYGLGAAWMLNWDACKYYTDAGFFVSSASLCMNLDVYNAMPKDLQDLLNKVMSEHQTRMVQFYAVDAPIQSEADLTAGGAEVYHLPAAERARWQEATKDIKASYFSKLDPDDVELIQGFIDEVNK
jgi:TRAP-type C4-dicarboxylate transport system substrate-binding protein